MHIITKWVLMCIFHSLKIINHCHKLYVYKTELSHGITVTSCLHWRKDIIIIFNANKKFSMLYTYMQVRQIYTI